MVKLIDLGGHRFGDWEVLRRAPNTAGGGTQWLCRCKCGTEAVVNGGHLRSGKSTKCSKHNPYRHKHGHADSPEYMAYCKAKQRCTNPNDPSYATYGGRGVQMLFASFEEWYKELGPRPSSSHRVNRVDNDGHYAPGNVRWTTRKQQRMNTLKVKLTAPRSVFKGLARDS